MANDLGEGLHFARVVPIVGEGLRRVRVALWGLPEAAPLVRYLAASGVGRWTWLESERESGRALEGELLARHGPALELDGQTWLDGPAPELLVAVGRGQKAETAIRLARLMHRPLLLVQPPTLTAPCQSWTRFPEDEAVDAAWWSEEEHEEIDRWGWRCAAALCAGLARAMLLRDTLYQRTDLAALWGEGVRCFTFADLAAPLPALFRTPAARRGMLLIAGLGSIGSVAALPLADEVAGMLLADPDRVDAYNPVRQAFGQADIGRPKAEALGDTLRAAGVPQIIPLPEALTDEEAVADLVARHGIRAALVATGTGADFAIARALRACDVPHVVGRCYPRARYWEAILVDGQRGPALSDLRGHLHLGPSPEPTPEQRAAYSDAGALEAEPATLIESGWAAAWMARLVAQFLAPPGLRERWFLELLASEQTCLVGGVGVEPTEDGPAYAIAHPGQIRAWGRAAIRRDGQ